MCFLCDIQKSTDLCFEREFRFIFRIYQTTGNYFITVNALPKVRFLSPYYSFCQKQTVIKSECKILIIIKQLSDAGV